MGSQLTSVGIDSQIGFDLFPTIPRIRFASGLILNDMSRRSLWADTPPDYADFAFQKGCSISKAFWRVVCIFQ
jgi:hypothetical protein